MTDKLSLLAVFAHPDDESCGPGATLAMYAHRGVEVGLLCVTRGERGAWGADQSIPLNEFGDIRVRELGNACAALGISRWTVLWYPDGEVSRYETEMLVHDILFQVWRSRPQVMITHPLEGPEGHPDHDAVARAATEAFQHAGNSRFCKYIRDCPPFEPLKLYYAVPPDPELAGRLGGQSALTELDVSSYAQTKVRALMHHRSQEECWRDQIKALFGSPRWTESFWLAHSRLPRGEDPEDDLFAGIQGTATTYGAQQTGDVQEN